MLPSGQRISRSQFSAFLKEKGAFTVYNSLGTLKFTPGREGFSVVTSSKHQKRAVIRNRLRRRIYTLFRLESPGISGILYCSKQSYTSDYETITRQFQDLLAKARAVAK